MQPERQHLVVTGVDIPMRDLVVLLVKLAIASIPALIILSVLWFLLGSLLMGVLMPKMSPL